MTALYYLITSLMLINFVPERADWTCTNPKWDGEPQVTNNIFTGKLDVTCTFKSKTAGDYRKLADLFVNETKEHTKVHSGPTETTFEGMPAIYFDSTMTVNEEGVEWIRADNTFATDGKDVFVASNLSKEIKASGFAANVQKIDNIARVKRAADANTHTAIITVRTQVKKPAIVGVKKFKEIVMNQSEKKLVEKEKEVIEAFINGL